MMTINFEYIIIIVDIVLIIEYLVGFDVDSILFSRETSKEIKFSRMYQNSPKWTIL